MQAHSDPTPVLDPALLADTHIPYAYDQDLDPDYEYEYEYDDQETEVEPTRRFLR